MNSPLKEKITEWYFETSAVNHLYNHVFSNPEFGSLATRNLQTQKGRNWKISAITLWEIFLTSNKAKRDDLFDFARCLFVDELFPTPEEIVINYIKQGCPLEESRYPLISKSLFSKEWKIACNDIDYFFAPEHEQIKGYSKHMKIFSKLFRDKEGKIVLQGYNNWNEVDNMLNRNFLIHNFENLVKFFGRNPKEEDKTFIATSMQVGMMLFCFGIGVDQSTIEQFWNKEKNIEPFERLEIAIKEFPNVFFRGPVANITKMILAQSKGKTSRGMMFDSFHSIYITYSDLYFSGDHHFQKMKAEHQNDPNMIKVFDVKDLSLSLAK